MNNNIYLIGDIHGDWRLLEYLCKDLTENDIVIQLGDHGINYYGGSHRDENMKKKIAKLKPTFIFLRGNHDRSLKDFENKLGYKLVHIQNDIIKGTFYLDEKFPNQLFLPRYDIFEVLGNRFLAISGSYSVDKNFRIMNGWNWFEDEQLSEDEKNEILETINTYEDWKSVDYIISHTCPFKYRPIHLFLDCIDQSQVDNSMEFFLEQVEEMVDYKHYFFGHFHATERLWDKGYMIYMDIKNLKDFD